MAARFLKIRLGKVAIRSVFATTDGSPAACGSTTAIRRRRPRGFPSSTAARVRKRRAALREAGPRPVQISGSRHSASGLCRGMPPAGTARRRVRPRGQDLAASSTPPQEFEREPVTEMRRGDLVTAVVQGDFGKPRPALVIQADAFTGHATVTVLLVLSTLIDAPLLRLTVRARRCERAAEAVADHDRQGDDDHADEARRDVRPSGRRRGRGRTAARRVSRNCKIAGIRPTAAPARR